MAKTPTGLRNISTTYQIAYETYDGNVQVRKLGPRLWEILPRGGATVYEKSKPEAIERAFQLAASRAISALQLGPRRRSARRTSRRG